MQPSRSAASKASTRQALTGSPSINTLQAPHSPSPRAPPPTVEFFERFRDAEAEIQAVMDAARAEGAENGVLHGVSSLSPGASPPPS